MADYSENVFHLNNYCFVFRGSAISRNQKLFFAEFNLFYKHLTQKHKILINKGKVVIIQNLRNNWYEIKYGNDNDNNDDDNIFFSVLEPKHKKTAQFYIKHKTEHTLKPKAFKKNLKKMTISKVAKVRQGQTS